MHEVDDKLAGLFNIAEGVLGASGTHARAEYQRRWVGASCHEETEGCEIQVAGCRDRADKRDRARVDGGHQDVVGLALRHVRKVESGKGLGHVLSISG